MTTMTNEVSSLEKAYRASQGKDALKAQNAESIISQFKIEDEHQALKTLATGVLARILEASYAERFRPYAESLVSRVDAALNGTVDNNGDIREDNVGQYVCNVSSNGEILSSEFRLDDDLVEEQHFFEDRNPYALTSQEYAINSLKLAIDQTNTSHIFKLLDLQLHLNEDTLLIRVTGPYKGPFRKEGVS